jgi:hypothetical protein
MVHGKNVISGNPTTRLRKAKGLSHLYFFLNGTETAIRQDTLDVDHIVACIVRTPEFSPSDA